MKWLTEVRGATRIHLCGKFKVLQSGSDCFLVYPGCPDLLYQSVDMAKRVAGYLHQGGLPV